MGRIRRLGWCRFETEHVRFLLLKSSHQLLQDGNRRHGFGAVTGA
jgi:hypothetical protein